MLGSQLDLVNDLVMGTQLSISTGERVTDFLTHRGNRMIPLEVRASASTPRVLSRDARWTDPATGTRHAHALTPCVSPCQYTVPERTLVVLLPFYVRRPVQVNELLRELPRRLREQALLDLYEPVLSTGQLFPHLDNRIIGTVLFYLEPQTFSPGEVVIKAGTPGAAMHVVCSGTRSPARCMDPSG